MNDEVYKQPNLMFAADRRRGIIGLLSSHSRVTLRYVNLRGVNLDPCACGLLDCLTNLKDSNGAFICAVLGVARVTTAKRLRTSKYRDLRVEVRRFSDAQSRPVGNRRASAFSYHSSSFLNCTVPFCARR
eukprot:6179282-Pleurochrysis_carterae.AAC.2